MTKDKDPYEVACDVWVEVRERASSYSGRSDGQNMRLFIGELVKILDKRYLMRSKLKQ